MNKKGKKPENLRRRDKIKKRKIGEAIWAGPKGDGRSSQ